MSPSLAPSSSLLGALAAVGLAGAALLPQRALAADLDPGYADIPPVQQQVTFGSGWYVRGDFAATDDTYKVGSTISSFVELRPEIFRTSKVGYDASLGGGYSFTNSFRGDVTVDFLQPQNFRGSTYGGSGRDAYLYDSGNLLNQYAALANGYYDFGTWSIVTPYVGVGAGVGFANAHLMSVGYISDGVYRRDTGSRYVSFYNFAWTAMAGVAIDVYNHTKLDIGYRYLSIGKILGKNVGYNEIRVGLRYMIDN